MRPKLRGLHETEVVSYGLIYYGRLMPKLLHELFECIITASVGKVLALPPPEFQPAAKKFFHELSLRSLGGKKIQY